MAGSYMYSYNTAPRWNGYKPRSNEREHGPWYKRPQYKRVSLWLLALLGAYYLYSLVRSSTYTSDIEQQIRSASFPKLSFFSAADDKATIAATAAATADDDSYIWALAGNSSVAQYIDSSFGTSNASHALLQRIFSAPKPSKPYKMTVACLYRNEAHYVEEWILYHYLLGVEHFYLYDNLSTDNSQKVLQPYVEAGIVTRYDWPGTLDSGIHGKMLDHYYSTSRDDSPMHDATWSGHFEVDEYMSTPFRLVLEDFDPLAPKPLHHWLGGFVWRNHTQIAMSRLEFDTNGHKHPISSDELLMVAMTSRSIQLESAPTAAKILYYHPALLLGGYPMGGHMGHPAPYHTLVDVQHEPYEENGHMRMITEPLYMHHYVARSWDECMAKSADSPWRQAAGQRLCDSKYKHSGSFDFTNAKDDFTLALTNYTQIVWNLRAHVRQNGWSTKSLR